MLEGFELTVQEHKDRVYTYAFYYLRNREEAEDATQEVLLRLWRHWSKLDREAVPAWLTTVTRNACLDRQRKRRRYRMLVEEDPDATATSKAEGGEPDPERRSQAADFRRHLDAALDRLSEPYRSIVILREIQELTYREISAALNLPLNTVKTYLHRGRRMLRERLSEVYRHAPVS